MRDLDVSPAGGRTTYAEQRDRTYAATLDAIDDVTGTCMGCGQPIPPGSLSDIFCAYKQGKQLVTCQYRALRDGTDSTAWDAEDALTPDQADAPTFIPGVSTFYRSFDFLDGGIVPPPVQAPLTPRQVAVHGTYTEWEGSGPMPAWNDGGPVEAPGQGFASSMRWASEPTATEPRKRWHQRHCGALKSAAKRWLLLVVVHAVVSAVLLTAMGIEGLPDPLTVLWAWVLFAAMALFLGFAGQAGSTGKSASKKRRIRRWFRRHILRKRTKVGLRRTEEERDA